MSAVVGNDDPLKNAETARKYWCSYAVGMRSAKNVLRLREFVTRHPDGSVQIDNEAICVVEFRSDEQLRKVIGRCPRIILKAGAESVLQIKPLTKYQLSAPYGARTIEPEIDMNDVIRVWTLSTGR